MKQRFKEPWAITKEMFLREPKMPPLTESKLKRPAFRFILELIKCTITNTGFGKGLFSEQELSYQSYISIDQELRFIDRLLDFIEKFSGKKLNVNPLLVVKARGDAEDAHCLLQTFSKYARTSKPSLIAVKAAKKDPILTGEKENTYSIKEARRQVGFTQVNFKEEKVYKTEAAKPIVDESQSKILEEEIIQLQRENNYSSSIISTLNRDISELKERVARITKDIEEANKENNNLESTVFIEESINRIKADLEGVNNEIREINEEIENLTNKLREQESQPDPEPALQKEYDELLAVNKRLEEELIASNNDVKLRESQELEKTIKRNKKDSEIARLKEEKDSLLKTIESYKQENEMHNHNLKSESIKKSEELKEMIETVAKLKDEVQGFKDKTPESSIYNAKTIKEQPLDSSIYNKEKAEESYISKSREELPEQESEVHKEEEKKQEEDKGEVSEEEEEQRQEKDKEEINEKEEEDRKESREDEMSKDDTESMRILDKETETELSKAEKDKSEVTSEVVSEVITAKEKNSEVVDETPRFKNKDEVKSPENDGYEDDFES